jgi:hypothetical protein
MGPEAVDPLSQVTSAFLSQGVAGAICVALVYAIIHLRGELRDERAAHKVEIAAKDALINELQEKRIIEGRVTIDAMNATRASLDAFLRAVQPRGGVA